MDGSRRPVAHVEGEEAQAELNAEESRHCGEHHSADRCGRAGRDRQATSDMPKMTPNEQQRR